MLRLYAHRRSANVELLRQLRDALGFLDLTAYRGTGRSVLDPYPSLDPTIVKVFADGGAAMESNRAARIRFYEIVGAELPELYEERLLPTLGEAREVQALVDVSADWEIIYVAAEPLARGERTLGYDLGWWGGEFYSLISDSAVDPFWHPPDPSDFHDLAKQLRVLNAHLLFDSPEDALAFKTYYTTKPWAETESFEGAFKVIRVDAV